MDAFAVGIISKHRLVRKALFCLLLTLPVSCRICIAADVDNVDDGAERIAASKPDILLIDCEGADDSLVCVRKVKMLSPSTKPLLLAGEVEERFAIAAVRSGAWGLVAKEADPALLQQAIQKLAEGEMWFSHGTMSMAIQSFANHRKPKGSPFDSLSQREIEVLGLLAKGCHNKEIASKLFLSESTIKTYVKAIYRKLGVNSRVEAVLVYNDNIVEESVASATPETVLSGAFE